MPTLKDGEDVNNPTAGNQGLAMAIHLLINARNGSAHHHGCGFHPKAMACQEEAMPLAPGALMENLRSALAHFAAASSS